MLKHLTELGPIYVKHSWPTQVVSKSQGQYFGADFINFMLLTCAKGVKVVANFLLENPPAQGI